MMAVCQSLFLFSSSPGPFFPHAIFFLVVSETFSYFPQGLKSLKSRIFVNAPLSPAGAGIFEKQPCLIRAEHRPGPESREAHRTLFELRPYEPQLGHRRCTLHPSRSEKAAQHQSACIVGVLRWTRNWTVVCLRIPSMRTSKAA